AVSVDEANRTWYRRIPDPRDGKRGRRRSGGVKLARQRNHHADTAALPCRGARRQPDCRRDRLMAENKPPLLVGEDDEGLRRQYRWSLGDYRVVSAGTREEALRLFERERPTVAIVDLGLPPDPDGAAEGLATLQGILSIAPETKVIIVSGNELRENAIK